MGPVVLGAMAPISGFWRSERGRSSAGRAPALQAGGHRFDPGRLHQGVRPCRVVQGNLIIRQYRGNQEFGVMGCWEPQGFLAVDPSFAFLAWNAVRAVGADLCSFAV
jgi:hypothetical protein